MIALLFFYVCISNLRALRLAVEAWANELNFCPRSPSPFFHHSANFRPEMSSNAFGRGQWVLLAVYLQACFADGKESAAWAPFSRSKENRAHLIELLEAWFRFDVACPSSGLNASNKQRCPSLSSSSYFGSTSTTKTRGRALLCSAYSDPIPTRSYFEDRLMLLSLLCFEAATLIIVLIFFFFNRLPLL